MPTYTTPGVYFEAVDQSSHGITAIRTDIAAFLGIAQMGPVHVPTSISSWEQFQSTFGNFIADGYLAYCAKAFFENGGQTLYGVRVAAPAMKTSTDSGVVQPADGLSSVVLDVAGFAPGALATISQTTTASASGSQPADRASSRLNTVAGFAAGSRVQVLQTTPSVVQGFHIAIAIDEDSSTLFWDSQLDPEFDLTQPIQFTSVREKELLVQRSDPGTRTVTWNGSLKNEFDLTQPIEFATGAWPAHARLYDGDANPTVELEALSPGVWGDNLSVFVAQTSLAASATSAQAQPTSGSANLLASTAGFSVGGVVKAYQDGVAPQYRIVTGIDPEMNLLIWDTALTAPINLANPISFESVEFSLTVYVNGTAKEIFSGLSLEQTSDRYIETAVNSVSQFILVKDLHSSAPYPDRLPDPSAPQLDDGVIRLRGGRDGIAALTARDFIGDPASETKWGLRTLEDLEEVSLVCAADILIAPTPAVAYAPLQPVVYDQCLPGTIPATVPQPGPLTVEASPRLSLADVFRVQQAMVAHCQAMKYRVALLDPPDFGYPHEHVDLAEIQAWRNRFDSGFAALYFPWVLVSDPLLLNNQIVRRVPPSGHIAGVCALTDTTVGVHKAPANVALQWAQDVTTEVTQNMQGVLNPLGVNCIRSFRGRGLRIFGARTLSAETSWQFLNVRRLLCMIEHALEIALQWAVFEPNSFYLWQQVRLSAITFLTSLWQKGALTGDTAADAFFVNCDQLTNSASTTSNGQMLAVIGVAATLPAEFVVFSIGRTENTLQVQEQS